MSTASRKLDPSKCALLIIDMQHRFDTIAKRIAPRLANFGKFCLERNIPVVLTMHHDRPDRTTELTKFWGDDARIVKGSYDWSFMPEIDSLSKEKGIMVLDDKIAYDAFRETDLEEQLKKLEVEQLLITGTVTNLCCETTARAAMVRNFQVFFVEDLNAADTPEHQKATIMNLSYGFAYITNEKEVRGVLNP